jgi:tripartite-type tricarboxylate transporter receptor subunit TctC
MERDHRSAEDAGADDPEVKEGMRRAGADTVKSSPDHFRSQIQKEMAQWEPLIKEIADKK